MKAIYTLLLAMLIGSSTSLMAQTVTVKGTVLTETGEPAANVTIMIKGTHTGTATNTSGQFSLALPKLPATLLFSYVGYAPSEYQVTAKNKSKAIITTIHASSSALSEVVVTGYPTVHKKEMVGAMLSVSASSINSEGRAVTSTLSGRLAGVSVSKDKAASSISIRGSRSLDSEMKPALMERDVDDLKMDRELRSTKLMTGKSKVLTAAEVSDFKKWKLWGDYSQSEFKTWSGHWGISPKDRYCVQVQNGDHKPMVGQKVFLINRESGDTVWSAVTDNTGKAELWANLHQRDEDSTYIIHCANKIVDYPFVFEQGINRIKIHKSCALSNIVDIAFVVDATGSMQDEITYLQSELDDIINHTSETHKDVDLHVGSVFYRDRGDQYLTRHIDFQKGSTPQLLEFINHQSANGGGDFPEAVDAALTTAIDSLQWHTDARSKILFLVLDAPPHSAAKARMYELINKAAAKGIRIVPIMCSGIDKSTEYLMRCIALATNGSYVTLTDDSGIGNKHIKPTTDEFKVELLNNLLQRLIGEMIYVLPCNEQPKTSLPLVSPVLKDVITSVYPNPTQGSINIQCNKPIKEVFIADFTGKVLLRLPGLKSNDRTRVNLGRYPSGSYLVKYFIEDAGWFTQQVVLQH
jgi:hypothetical protein